VKSQGEVGQSVKIERFSQFPFTLHESKTLLSLPPLDGNLELDGTTGQLWRAEGGLCVIGSLGDFRLACFENA
jgi:hypothetical protein